MGNIDWLRYVVIAATCSAIHASAIHAQSPPNTVPLQSRSKTEAGQSPSIDPVNTGFITENITPELLEIVKRWEAAATKLKTPCGQFSRSEVNLISGFEKVSRGKFFAESLHHWRVDETFAKVRDQNLKDNVKLDANPDPLESDEFQRWICTNSTFYWLNGEARTYERELIPEEFQQSERIQIPFPLLFFMKPRAAITGLRLSISVEDEETLTILAISDEPLVLDWGDGCLLNVMSGNRRRNFKEMTITLSKKTFLPTRIRLLNHNFVETVYTFEKVFAAQHQDVFHPDMLQKYRDISPD